VQTKREKEGMKKATTHSTTTMCIMILVFGIETNPVKEIVRGREEIEAHAGSNSRILQLASDVTNIA
jgi:hypothetical protein